jgi:hypothetical protein
MIFDSFILFGAIILVCIAWAEFGKKQAFGILGSILLLVMGFWIYSDGLQIQTGQITTFSGLDNTTGLANLTGNHLQGENSTTTNSSTSSTTAISMNDSTASTSSTSFGHLETTTKVYADIPATPFLSLKIKDFLGLIFNLLGLAGLLYYSLQPWGNGSLKRQRQ